MHMVATMMVKRTQVTIIPTPHGTMLVAERVRGPISPVKQLFPFTSFMHCTRHILWRAETHPLAVPLLSAAPGLTPPAPTAEGPYEFVSTRRTCALPFAASPGVARGGVLQGFSMPARVFDALTSGVAEGISWFGTCGCPMVHLAAAVTLRPLGLLATCISLVFHTWLTPLVVRGLPMSTSHCFLWLPLLFTRLFSELA